MTVPDPRRLHVLAPGKRLIKAVDVIGGDALERAFDFATADADALLLDSRTADRLGGAAEPTTGRSAPGSSLRPHPCRSTSPEG